MRFRKTLMLFLLAMGLVFALPTWAQQKPFTQDQVQGLVRDGLGDEAGAKAIEQRGIDFAPTEDFLQSLKAAGANEAFLKALRTAKPPEPASAKKPLNQVQVFALLAGGVPSHRVTLLVQERGIDFAPTDDYLQEVRLAGGEDELIGALKIAKVTKPEHVDPALQVRQAEIRQHAARGAQLANKGHYAEAEQEYREALQLDSQNDDLYVNLAYVLIQQKKWDDAESAAREAVRLNPNNDMAHNNLGAALEDKGDLDGGIAEYRDALRLNPDLEPAHIGLGVAMGRKGDWDGAIVEEREVIRLNPQDASAHIGLGVALGRKGDWDGEIAEEREALRLDPDNAVAHAGLGLALEVKGDRRGALEEYHAAYTLDPKNAQFKQAYERLLQPSSQVEEPTPTDISGEWKSLTSGSTFKLRLEQGHAYVERLFTDEQRAAGEFQLCDLKMEDGRYSGVCNIQHVLTWNNKSGQHQRLCGNQVQMAFTKHTPTRVEGSMEVITSFAFWTGCAKRSKKPEWKDFVWIRPN
jgi:Flp pilus assembly protein TadD